MKRIIVLYIILWACKSLAQAPPDPHWLMIWNDDFKSGGHSLSYYKARGWDVSDDFDRGEPQVYRNTNCVLVGGTGLVLSIKRDNYTCTSCTNGGVFKNNGTSWSTINGDTATGLRISQDISALKIIGTKLFAATKDAGVYMSTLGTTAWVAVNGGAAPSNTLTNLFVNCLAVNTTDIFAGTRHGGVFRSTDNGTNWTAINGTSLSGKVISSLAINGTDLYAGTEGYGVYKSSNWGTSWASVGTGPGNSIIKSVYFSGSLYAGTTQGLYVYNGSSWSAINGTSPNVLAANTTVRSIIKSGSNLFVGTSDGVYLSTDSGVNWTRKLAKDINSIITNGTTLYAGTSEEGVYLTTNNGTSWAAPAQTTLDFTDKTVTALILDGSNLIAGVPGSYKPHHYYSGASFNTRVYNDSITGLPDSSHIPEYGYIEARIKVPDTVGTWSAFWFWSTEGSVGDNSIESFEIVPGSKVTCSESPYYNTIHSKYLMTNCMYYLENPYTVACGGADYDYNLTAQAHYINDYTAFHTYGVEWSPSRIIYYVDGVAIRSSPNPLPGVYGRKSLILSLSLYDWLAASNNGDNPDYKYNFFTDVPRYLPYGGQAQLIVEYVKYYQLNNDCQASFTANSLSNLNTYDNKVKRKITIDGSGTNFDATSLSPKALRGVDSIKIVRDFTVPSGVELYLDADDCY